MAAGDYGYDPITGLPFLRDGTLDYGDGGDQNIPRSGGGNGPFDTGTPPITFGKQLVDTDGSITGIPGSTYQYDSRGQIHTIGSPRAGSGGTTVIAPGASTSAWSRITDPATGDVWNYNEITNEKVLVFKGNGPTGGGGGHNWQQVKNPDGSISLVDMNAADPASTSEFFAPPGAAGGSDLHYFQGADGQEYAYDPSTGKTTGIGGGSSGGGASPAVRISGISIGSGGGGGGGGGGGAGVESANTSAQIADNAAQREWQAEQNRLSREQSAQLSGLDRAQQAAQYAAQDARERVSLAQQGAKDYASELGATDPNALGAFLFANGGNINNGLRAGGDALSNAAAMPAARTLESLNQLNTPAPAPAAPAPAANNTGTGALGPTAPIGGTGDGSPGGGSPAPAAGTPPPTDRASLRAAQADKIQAGLSARPGALDWTGSNMDTGVMNGLPGTAYGGAGAPQGAAQPSGLSGIQVGGTTIDASDPNFNDILARPQFLENGGKFAPNVGGGPGHWAAEDANRIAMNTQLPDANDASQPGWRGNPYATSQKANGDVTGIGFQPIYTGAAAEVAARNAAATPTARPTSSLLGANGQAKPAPTDVPGFGAGFPGGGGPPPNRQATAGGVSADSGQAPPAAPAPTPQAQGIPLARGYRVVPIEAGFNTSRLSKGVRIYDVSTGKPVEITSRNVILPAGKYGIGYASGGPGAGLFVTGDQHNGRLTGHEEAVYAPHGAMVFNHRQTLGMMGGRRGLQSALTGLRPDGSNMMPMAPMGLRRAADGFDMNAYLQGFSNDYGAGAYQTPAPTYTAPNAAIAAPAPTQTLSPGQLAAMNTASANMAPQPVHRQDQPQPVPLHTPAPAPAPIPYGADTHNTAIPPALAPVTSGGAPATAPASGLSSAAAGALGATGGLGAPTPPVAATPGAGNTYGGQAGAASAGVQPYTDSALGLTGTDQGYLDTVLGQRRAAQYPDLNPFAVDLANVSPTVQNAFYAGRQTRYGIPVADQQAETDRYGLKGAINNARYLDPTALAY